MVASLTWRCISKSFVTLLTLKRLFSPSCALSPVESGDSPDPKGTNSVFAIITGLRGFSPWLDNARRRAEAPGF